MCSTVTAAPVTQSMTYQGKLTDAAGNPLTGTYTMTFRLYGVASGGSALDTMIQDVSVNKGLFTIPLTFDTSFFDGSALWLGVKVGADAEMTPRQELRPVPYALSLRPSTRTRTISFPANALNYDKTSLIIRQFNDGLQWSRDYSNGAFLILSRPDDWDGTSDVVMHLYFYPLTATSGDVDFFIRPRAFTPNVDSWYDLGSINGGPVPVAGALAIKEQTFIIPASSFGSKALWYITIQNEGAGSTYPDDVVVMAVSLTYTATR